MPSGHSDSPGTIRTRQLTIGALVQRKAEPDDVLTIRQVWRRDRRVQLVRETGDQPPFSVSFYDLTRDFRSVR